MTHTVRTAFLAAIVWLPATAFAGGYGTAGVKDATVGQSTAQTATIWCPKLKTEVPITLAQQMDCGAGVAVGTAQPAVARERFGGRGLFGLPPHQPSGGRSALDDDDSPITGGTPPVQPGDETPSDDPGRPNDDPPNDEPERPNDDPPSDDTPDQGSGSKSKWERLSDFGVNGENYNEQPREFKQAVKEFREKNGVKGDWSDFDPSSGPEQQ